MINWQDPLTIIILLTSLAIWIYSRLDRKFEKLNRRFDTLEEKLNKR